MPLCRLALARQHRHEAVPALHLGVVRVGSAAWGFGNPAMTDSESLSEKLQQDLS